jgi:hypothetical protein
MANLLGAKEAPASSTKDCEKLKRGRPKKVDPMTKPIVMWEPGKYKDESNLYLRLTEDSDHVHINVVDHSGKPLGSSYICGIDKRSRKLLRFSSLAPELGLPVTKDRLIEQEK